MEIRQTGHESPQQAGDDEPVGTTELVQHRLTGTDDVDCLIPSY